MENDKPRKISFTILAFFYIFLHIYKVFLKKKKKRDKQNWADSGPDGPSLRENGTRPRPRGRFCAEALGVLTKPEQGRSLLRRVTDTYKKAPAFLSICNRKSPTALAHRRAPASIYAGRLGQRPGSPSNGHEINTTPTISPNLIWLFINYGALATLAVSITARQPCSRRWVAV